MEHVRDVGRGFEVCRLTGEEISLTVVPRCGARVVSIKDLVNGREWLDGWDPPESRRLWLPADPADFASGPGAGLDECLPTVAPCEVDGRFLPDHGELWNRPTEVEVDERIGMRSRWMLESLPLSFERRIGIDGRQVRFDYRIRNLAGEPTPFQWAWHPLFRFEQGDELVFPGDPGGCVDPDGGRMPWPKFRPDCDLSRARFGDGGQACAKVFVGPLATGHARLVAVGGATLDIHWPTDVLPWAGVWITRGAWKGLHHWAVEPTNVPVDRLRDAMSRPELRQHASLAPRETREWHVSLEFSGSMPGVVPR